MILITPQTQAQTLNCVCRLSLVQGCRSVQRRPSNPFSDGFTGAATAGAPPAAAAVAGAIAAGFPATSDALQHGASGDANTVWSEVRVHVSHLSQSRLF